MTECKTASLSAMKKQRAMGVATGHVIQVGKAPVKVTPELRDQVGFTPYGREGWHSKQLGWMRKKGFCNRREVLLFPASIIV